MLLKFQSDLSSLEKLLWMLPMFAAIYAPAHKVHLVVVVIAHFNSMDLPAASLPTAPTRCAGQTLSVRFFPSTDMLPLWTNSKLLQRY